MAHVEELLSRQRILASFGEFAMRSDRLDEILHAACRLVAETLGTGRAKVLAIEDDGQTLLVRAGVGWGNGIVGEVRFPMTARSSEACSIRLRKPVVSHDLRRDGRFDVPDFVTKAGVVALANVPIFLPGGEAFGLLQIDSTRPREFQDEDIHFLKTYATILGPVLDRLRKIEALRSAELRFRLIVEQTRDYCIFITDAQDRIVEWLPGAAAVFGWTEGEALGRPGSLVFTEEDVAAGAHLEEVERARRNGSTPSQRWHKHKDGSLVYIDGFVTALKQGKETQGFMKIGRDMSDRRQAEDRQRVLLSELQHRTRNILAVVKSVAWKTASNSASLDQFTGSFRRRLDALARVNAMLSQLEHGDRITFDELVRTEMEAHGADDGAHRQVVLEGPEGVRLRSSTVQTLALALHELATNAVKYGGLSSPAGRPRVTWRVWDHERRPFVSACPLGGNGPRSDRQRSDQRVGLWPRADRTRAALSASGDDEI